MTLKLGYSYSSFFIGILHSQNLVNSQKKNKDTTNNINCNWIQSSTIIVGVSKNRYGKEKSWQEFLIRNLMLIWILKLFHLVFTASVYQGNHIHCFTTILVLLHFKSKSWPKGISQGQTSSLCAWHWLQSRRITIRHWWVDCCVSSLPVLQQQAEVILNRVWRSRKQEAKINFCLPVIISSSIIVGGFFSPSSMEDLRRHSLECSGQKGTQSTRGCPSKKCWPTSIKEIQQS